MNRPHCLLVVDDDPDIRDLVAVNFAVEGFDVLTAADGNEAERIIRSEQPDIVILDIMMPGRDGLEVLRALRNDPATEDVNVVLLTARSASEDMLEARRSRPNRYMTKPFDPDELVRYVRSLLGDD